ncbi:hypothetical protein Q4543_15085 [Salipiger sp. 1_MG-2023]|uniref:transcription termination/antitermination protein NusG n=1 Tax=Salipiger sp. 1_MG-2023 TaxID=3062665 RepID=UPI0026E3CEB7|nr:transcription termination/antitermination NusG family protein [Salipiger sp. 1_MG-2023]MDO6586836.1 hypothetical protein [Salipiger sp. 1_MG-2023]
MMHGKVEAMAMDWFAVRFRVKHNPGRTTCVIGAEREAYVDRRGRSRVRAVTGTGTRVFVPELLCRRAGFEVFLPVRKDWRRKNQFSAEKELRSFPLIPGWMFVGWQAGASRWHELAALDVIDAPFGVNGRPLRIPEQRIVALMRQWGGGRLSPEMNRYMRAGHEFAIGDRMRIACGPFDGFEARVIGVDGPQARALVDFFGREQVVTLATASLEQW